MHAHHLALKQLPTSCLFCLSSCFDPIAVSLPGDCSTLHFFLPWSVQMVLPFLFIIFFCHWRHVHLEAWSSQSRPQYTWHCLLTIVHASAFLMEWLTVILLGDSEETLRALANSDQMMISSGFVTGSFISKLPVTGSRWNRYQLAYTVITPDCSTVKLDKCQENWS